MTSIYEVINLEERAAPAPMPLQLSHMGCGRHQFEKDEEGSYWCVNVGCSTVVRPGQLLYQPLQESMGER